MMNVLEECSNCQIFLTNLFKTITNKVIEYMPNLLTIPIIILLAWLSMKILRSVANSLYREEIKIRGFQKEWIYPSYQIIKFFIIIFAIIMIFPHLPGSDLPSFQAISIFLGAMFTLGSRSAIANILAGIVLIYMSPYKRGDRVKIGDSIGNISDMELLVTRIRTLKNEVVTVPNSLILDQPVTNFTTGADTNFKPIIHTELTIGYNIEPEKVTELLLEAAKAVEGVLEEPKPFVFIRHLNDFAINYELNLHSENPNDTLRIQSDLHRNIYSNFKEAKVDILSPSFVAYRDEKNLTHDNQKNL